MKSEEDKLIEIRQRLATAKEKVLRSALNLASTHFAQDAADPGWEADMYEDYLNVAILEYGVARADLISVQETGDVADSMVGLLLNPGTYGQLPKPLPFSKQRTVTFPVVLSLAKVSDPDAILLVQPFGSFTVNPGDSLDLKMLLNEDGTPHINVTYE